MLDLTPWSLGDSLANVHERYHPTLEWLYSEILQENEPVFIAAEASIPRADETGKIHLTGGGPGKSEPWLIVMTEYRWLMAGWQYGGGYIKYGEHILGLGTLRDRVFNKEWVLPPNRSSGINRLGRKREYQNVAYYYRETSLESVPQVISKKGFAKVHKGNTHNLVEIRFHDRWSWVTFRTEDGERVYSLLQLVRQNNGRITLPELPSGPTVSRVAFIDELERLGQLRVQGLLTDDEFQQAKKRLLELE